MRVEIRPKLFVFGIDGADYELMQHLMASGWLPNLKSFAADAFAGPLRCTWPPHTATGWPTLFSGCLPGQHGIFQFWDCQAPDYSLVTTRSSDLGVPYLWDAFAEADFSVGLTNIPMSYPPNEWKGYEITWPLEKTLRYARPPGLLTRISDANGLALPDIACMFDGQPNYPERAKGFIQARTRTVKYLLQNEPVDVAAVVYTEVDRVSHHYWHEIDRSHPAYSRNHNYNAALLDIYGEIDKAFGQILELLPDKCTILVVSDHGFGVAKTGIRLQQVLAQGEFLVFQKPIEPKTVVDHILLETKAEVTVREGIDWNRTVAYMPTPGCFGVNLNLSGRQSKGIVQKTDKSYLLQDITDYLLSLKYPHTDLAVFSAVISSAQAYAGEFVERAPDLLLVPSSPDTMMLYNPSGDIWDTAGQSGSHYIQGVFILRTDGIASHTTTHDIAIEDVSGYLIHNLEVPQSLIAPIESLEDATEVCQHRGIPTAAWRPQKNRILNWDIRMKGESSLADTSIDNQIVPETDDAIIERLRKMGYME